MLLPYSDTQCGAKVFRRKAIESTLDKIESTKWALEVDILYKFKKQGFKVKEIPTIWRDQEGSTVDLKKTPIQMFSAVVRLRMIHSPFKFIVRLYDKLPESIKIHH